MKMMTIIISSFILISLFAFCIYAYNSNKQVQTQLSIDNPSENINPIELMQDLGGTTVGDNITKVYENVTLTIPNGQELSLFGSKYSNNSGIILLSKEHHMCSWYPDNSPKNKSKYCEVEFQVDGLDRVTLDNKIKLNLTTFNKYNPVYKYSTTSQNIKEEFDTSTYDENGTILISKTSVVDKKSYSNYKPLALATESNLNSISVIASFDMPKYSSEHFDIKIDGLGTKSLSLDPDVSSCGLLSTANSAYTLTDNVTTTATCFNVTANNITIDCQGYTINYSSAGTVGYGVYSMGSNFTTVKNCVVKEGTAGGNIKPAIYFNGASNGTIYNNTIRTLGNSASYGIYLSTSLYNDITNNNITTSNDAGHGIYLVTNSLNNNIMNNVIRITYSSANAHGIYLSTNNSILINNTIITTGRGIYLNSVSNNILTNNTISVSDYRGIGIYSLSSGNNTLTGNAVNTSQSQSYVITGTTIGHYNQSIDSSNLAEGKPVNYTFNGQNIIIQNNNSFGQVICGWCNNVTYSNITVTNGDGINLFRSSNSTIKNSNVNTNKGYGIWLYTSSVSNNVSNNAINTTGSYGYGITLDTNSNYNVVGNNSVWTNGSSATGIYLLGTSKFNNLTNNIITTTGRYGSGIYLVSSSWNTISNNNASVLQDASGIYLETSGNSTIKNNIITIGSTGSTGIYFMTDGGNNVVSNTTIISSSSNGYGMYLRWGSVNNSFSGMNIKTSGTGNPIYVSNSVWNFIMADSILNSSAAGVQDFFIAGAVTGGIWNFTNVSRADGSPITVSWTAGANGTMNYMNYLEVNVTNMSYSPLSGANVTLWNISGADGFSILTNASGNIPRQTVLAWTRINNTILNAFTPHQLNITLTNYSEYFNNSINMNSSRYLNILMNLSGAGDLEYPLFYGYFDNNATLVGSGLATFNVSINSTNGTVILQVNSTTNYTAFNSTGNVFNVSVTLQNGTYTYRWHSYGNGTSHFYNKSSDRFYTINDSDVTYPLFSNNQTTPVNNTEYTPNGIYEFNITIADTNGTTGLEFNGTNYSLTNLSTVFNKTFSDLSAGTYNYYYWAFGNGTSNNYNTSNVYSYTIAKNNTYSLGLTISPSNNENYGTETTATGSNCPAELTCNLTLNSTGIVDNPHIITLGAGIYNYTYNTTGNVNYSTKEISGLLTINQIASQTSLLINETSPKVYGTNIKVNCSKITGVGNVVLFRDGVDVTAENNIGTLLGVGTYAYECNLSTTQNYTASTNTSSFEITKATPTLTFTANGGTSNLTLTYPQQVNITATNDSGTLSLTKDNADYSSNGLNKTLGVGSYIFKANITGNQNYSDVIDRYYNVTINKSTSLIYLYLNHSRSNITIINSTAIYLNASSITGEGDVELWINETKINSGTSPIYNISDFNNITGLYNVTAILPATQNYTFSAETWWVNVTPPEPDNEYPLFSNYWDNNGSLNSSGLGLFNVTILNTNGTVWLEINNTNITAFNSTGNVFNVSYDFTLNKTYEYKWYAYGNGTSHNLNNSGIRYYTVNETYPDNEYPLFYNFVNKIANDSEYNIGNLYIFNISINNTNATVGLEFNNINYSTSNISNVFNSSIIRNLSAGSYIYYWWAYGNGTSHNFNTSGVYNYSVNKSLGLTGLTFDVASPQVYPQAITPTCSIVKGETTATLKADGMTITSGSPITLGVANWNMNCSIPATQNFTGFENTTTYEITQGTPPLVITMNPTSTVENGTETTTTGVGCPTELTCNLFKENSSVSNPDIQTLEVGTYVYVFNTTGNTNYTFFTIDKLLTITNVTTPIVITGATPTCRYKKFGYYNTRLPWIRQTNCV